MALAVLAMPASAATPGPWTPAGPNLTKTEARQAFAQAMLFCLGSRIAGQEIKDAPEDVRAFYVPAPPNDREWADWGHSLPASTPVWMSRRLGHLLYIVEPSPEQCEVHSSELPIDETFQLVVSTMRQQFADVFTPVTPKPGVSPFAYQFEHVEGGVRYVFHMEGAERSSPGQELRVNILYGVVLRQPATAPPAFR